MSQQILVNQNPPSPGDATVTCASPTICPTTNNAVLQYNGQPFALTSVQTSGFFTEFSGAITNGGNNFWGASQTVFRVSGFNNPQNNGTFLCLSSTAAALFCIERGLGIVPETTAAMAIPLIVGEDERQTVSAELIGANSESVPGASQPLTPFDQIVNVGSGCPQRIVNPA